MLHDFSEQPYRFSYGELTPYAKSESLVLQHCRPGELILDLGCGYGALAERLRDAGYTYVGLDADWMALKDLSSRGFETHQCEISAAEDFERRLREIVGDRSLGGFLLLDVIEHLVDSEGVLGLLRSVAIDHSVAPLIICVPNVTHFDLGAKLLQGRWDETPTGILDRTHVGFYSARKLEAVTKRCGWSQIGRADFQADESDQHFPADNVALTSGTLLNSVLKRVRERSSEGSDVIQFIRAYVPGPIASWEEDELPEHAPFLSVLTRTQGTRLDTLQEALLCLAAQDCDDYEVLVLAHNVTPSQMEMVQYFVHSLPPNAADRFRVVPVTGRGRCRPLNVGVQKAKGAYIAVLDDDDLVLAHWVSTFKDLANHWPGRLLRSVVATQDIAEGGWPDRPGYLPLSGTKPTFPVEFDLFRHFLDNYTPLCGLAFPRSIFTDLGLAFDESLPVLEDWDLELQTALLCGVASSPETTSIYRLWQLGMNSSSLHSTGEWAGAREAVIRKLDQGASIFPPGTVSKLRDLQWELQAARDKLLDAEYQLEQSRLEVNHWRHQNSVTAHELSGEVVKLRESFEKSTSWRITKPLRHISGRLKVARPDQSPDSSQSRSD